MPGALGVLRRTADRVAGAQVVCGGLAGPLRIDPALATRLSDPTSRARLHRRLPAHLATLDSIEAARHDQFGEAAECFDRAARACATTDELEPLVAKCAYFLCCPAHRPRAAAVRCEEQLRGLAARSREPRVRRLLEDAATYVRIWSLAVLWRSGRRRDAWSSAAALLRGQPGRLAGASLRLLARQSARWSASARPPGRNFRR